MQQESFVGEGWDEFSRETLPIQKRQNSSAKPSVSKKVGFSSTSYATVLRQPKAPDGRPLGCPCGRIYVLPHVEGTFMFADRNVTAIGDPKFIVARGLLLEDAEKHLRTFGCSLHRTPLHSLADDSPEPLACRCGRAVAVCKAKSIVFMDRHTRDVLRTLRGEASAPLGKARRLAVEVGCALHP